MKNKHTLFLALVAILVWQGFLGNTSIVRAEPLEQIFASYMDLLEKAKSGKADEVIALLNDVISLDQDNFAEYKVEPEEQAVHKLVAIYFRGLIRLYQQGFYNEAIRDLDMSLEIVNETIPGGQALDSIRMMAWGHRAHAFYLAGDYDAALLDLTNAHLVFKGFELTAQSATAAAAIYSGRGKLNSAAEHHVEALNDFRKAIELGSTDSQTLFGYAYELDLAEQDETARLFYQRAGVDPETTDARLLVFPITLKTKAFISKRILAASNFMNIPDDMASSALLYAKAYSPGMDTGQLTTRIQHILSSLGYTPGDPDGIAGPETRSAIRAFQQDYGMPPDGEPTEELYGRLKRIVSGDESIHGKTGGLVTTLPELVKATMPAMVTVACYDGTDETSGKAGSGFFIAANTVVTNFHVLEGAKRITITLHDRQTKTARILRTDKSIDLSLLAIPTSGTTQKVLSIATRLPKVGEPIIAIGNPLGFEQTVSDGIVSGIREWGDNWLLLQITAPISPGSSGGPVVNMKGEVVGVSTLVIREGQNLNFAVSSKVLRAFANKALR